MKLEQKDLERYWSKIARADDTECWVWLGTRNRNGYGVIGFGGRGKSDVLAHRVSVSLSGRNVEGLVVRHTCDNPSCVNPNHLLTGTQGDNARDMAIRERGNTRKLTASEVVAIRRLHLAGESIRQLARDFGVTYGNVGFIVRNKTWRHLL